MIAYNYCYSTCLGRIKPFQGQYKFGVTNLDLDPGILEVLQEHITGSDNYSFSMSFRLTTVVCSRAERHHVCQVERPKGTFGSYACRTFEYTCDGEASFEGCEI
jgi:hypothetical protein